jgi:Uma2 family endonuclease
MGETDDHREAMVRHIELLQDYYRGQNVYVSGDLLVYYVQGNPRKFIVPDAFVVKGIPPGKRRTYKIWVEGKSPDMVIETTSRKTRKKDMQEKPDLYEQLGVKEYFLFDPHQEYLVPQLQGYRLTPAGYRRIEAGTGGELISVELGLRLSLADGLLQFHRVDTGERLLTRAERAEWEKESRPAARSGGAATRNGSSIGSRSRGRAAARRVGPLAATRNLKSAHVGCGSSIYLRFSSSHVASSLRRSATWRRSRNELRHNAAPRNRT